MAQHKNGVGAGFTSRYGVTSLVYFEIYSDIRIAIAREKTIKRWSRSRKYKLIESHNPDWRDLSADWFRDAVATT